MSIIPQKCCIQCGIDKPLSEFHPRPDSRDGYRGQCKQCHSAAQAARKAARICGDRPYIERSSKHCPQCGIDKPIAEYRADRSSADGRSGYCSACRRSASEEYRVQHHDRVLASSRKQRQMHMDRKVAYNRLWVARNRDRYEAYHAQYRKANRMRFRMSGRRWRKRHPDAVVRAAHRRRALQRQNGGDYTVAEWQALCAYYDWRCLCCGEQKTLTVDHVVPVAHGGSNDISNLQPLCGECNSRKGAKTIDYRAELT
jgi:5-methylcytosine-specific restriction endonuclease McrA